MELDFAKETKKQLVKDFFVYMAKIKYIKREREREKWRTSRFAKY